MYQEPAEAAFWEYFKWLKSFVAIQSLTVAFAAASSRDFEALR